MRTVSIVTLPDFLTNLMMTSGAKVVTILAETDPSMRKTGNPFIGRVRKVTLANVSIGFVYANSVNRARVKEGVEPDFTPAPRKWGVRINGTPLVEHKGQYYLEVRWLRTMSSFLTLDREEVKDEETLADIKSFIPTKSSNAEHQGLEDEIILRDYKLESIRALIYGGETTLIQGGQE